MRLLVCGSRCGYREVMNDGARVSGSAVARAQGTFNIAFGLWPLIHRRSFEGVFGPKRDYWIAATVALLLVGNGTVQLLNASTPEGVAFSKRLGMTTAAALAGVDVVNVARGRIRSTYLVDAAAEVGWLGVWARAVSAAS
jgi:hypothetical protein